MPVSPTTPGRLGARDIAPIRIALRQRNDVGAGKGTFAAQWPAVRSPVNASLMPSRATVHDSGSMRFATPPSYGLAPSTPCRSPGALRITLHSQRQTVHAGPVRQCQDGTRAPQQALLVAERVAAGVAS
jgi:hypothetical protein